MGITETISRFFVFVVGYKRMEELITDNQWVIWLIIIIGLWTLPWKAVALWKAARQGAKYWFVALLVINTVGLLEILYIFIFSKKRQLKNKEVE